MPPPTSPSPVQRPFRQVDVFTTTAYKGNPLAVVLDGQGLDDVAMQRFAAWTNLSETTFLLPPSGAGRQAGADYRVRIFTPGGELPFAGHPTLGSCHAWLEAGGQPRRSDGTVLQECAIGLVPVQQQGKLQAFAAPALRRSNPAPGQLAQVASALGLKASQLVAAQLLDNGPVWLGLCVDSAQTVLALAPDHAQLKNLGIKVGVVHIRRASPAIHSIAESDSADMVVRAFAAPVGITEDPVTGSLNAALAQWLMADGMAPERYVAAQGERLGRAGRVHIQRDAAGQVWVGGQSVTCISGSVWL